MDVEEDDLGARASKKRDRKEKEPKPKKKGKGANDDDEALAATTTTTSTVKEPTLVPVPKMFVLKHFLCSFWSYLTNLGLVLVLTAERNKSWQRLMIWDCELIWVPMLCLRFVSSQCSTLTIGYTTWETHLFMQINSHIGFQFEHGGDFDRLCDCGRWFLG